MEKPKLEKVERWNYHECAQYIGYKLGYDIDDTLGKYNVNSISTEDLEYRSFWDYLLNTVDIHNGSLFYMPDPKDEGYIDEEEQWVKPILEAFWTEFGEGPYWVEW